MTRARLWLVLLISLSTVTGWTSPIPRLPRIFLSPPTQSCTSYAKNYGTFSTLLLSSSSADDTSDPPPLITTSTPDDLSPAESMFLSQQSWTAVSKSNNEAAKAKLLEEARLEELADEARRAKKEGNPEAENYGPGDLSDLGGGVMDDGAWESSKGDKDSEAELGLMLVDNGEEEAKTENDDNGMLILGGEDPNPGGLIF